MVIVVEIRLQKDSLIFFIQNSFTRLKNTLSIKRYNRKQISENHVRINKMATKNVKMKLKIIYNSDSYTVDEFSAYPAYPAGGLSHTTPESQGFDALKGLGKKCLPVFPALTMCKNKTNNKSINSRKYKIK